MTRQVCAGSLIRALSERGWSAHVEQTGGGVATLYSRRTYTDEEGNERAYVIAGPGSYEWRTPARSLFWWEELSVGRDIDGGDVDSVYVSTVQDFCDAWANAWNRTHEAVRQERASSVDSCPIERGQDGQWEWTVTAPIFTSFFDGGA